MEISGGDSVRGRPVWRGTFEVSGGMVLYRVRDSSFSWFDSTNFTSLRFVQRLNEGRYHADRDFQIEPDRGTYTNKGRTSPTVEEPLDDVSFVYFVRSLPLVVGKRYEFRRYFQVDGNPVVINVDRCERVTVPAGTFDAIVIRPEITTSGLFSQNGRAELWIAADSTRAILQLKSRLSIGSLNLYLTGYTPRTPRTDGDSVRRAHTR